MEQYLVSARKYRPATFSTVVGQSHITSTLKNAIGRGQLAHAYLFCGPRGVGKTTCARIFAKAINCQSPQSDEACGECESCRAFDEGRSFTIHELDAASNNSVDDIRSLTEQVRIPPQIGRYSVYIIDEVHMLSQAAFNAFLKTLEEPPAHAVFVLATTEKHKIIPTILSRCQIFDFNRIRVEDVVGYLKDIATSEGVETDDQSLHLIAMKADGGMRDALSMFDKAVSFCGTTLTYAEVAKTLNVLDYETYFRMTDSLSQGDYRTALTIFDEILQKGFTPQIFVTGLNAHFRDLLMALDPSTLTMVEASGALLDKYRTQAAGFSPADLFSAISLLTTVDGTLRTASSQRLNIELALMKLTAHFKKKELTDSDFTRSEAVLNALPEIKKEVCGEQSVTPPKPLTVQEPERIPLRRTIVPAPEMSAKPGENRPVGAAKEKIQKAAANATPANSPTGRDLLANDTTATDNETQPVPDPIPAATGQPDGINIAGSAEKITANHTGEETQLAQAAIPGSERHEGNISEPATDGWEGKKPLKPTSRKILHGLPQGISGTPISSILDSRNDLEDITTENHSEADTLPAEDFVEPIETVRLAFIEKLRSERPRFAVALDEMVVDESGIRVTVPTETLREDLLRNSSEILYILTELAGLRRPVPFSVDVAEDNGRRKPIKPEDKLKWLTEINPDITLLRKELNLEID